MDNTTGSHVRQHAASDDGQRALDRDLRDLIHTFNRSGDSTAVIPGEYLEVVILRN
jgi:hypothetical protein